MTYVHIELQKKIQRIIIKEKGDSFYGTKAHFILIWERTVGKFSKMKVEFDKADMLTIYNEENNISFVLSYDFCRSLGFQEVTVGKQTQTTDKSINSNEQHQLEFWYMDIYSTKLETTNKTKFIENLKLSLYPWRSRSIKQLLHHINFKVEKFLENNLKSAYDKKKHNFQISMEASDHCKLTIGDWIKIVMSSNLTYLLSLPNDLLQGPTIIGMREVDVLETHSRQLFLLCNAMKPTSTGEKEKHIICNFLHKASSDKITEKRFTPISYHPVARNYIDQIHIQLTDSDYHPISISDVKTLVTLYFQEDK